MWRILKGLYLFLVVSYFEEKSKIIENKFYVEWNSIDIYYYFDLRLTYYLLIWSDSTRTM